MRYLTDFDDEPRVQMPEGRPPATFVLLMWALAMLVLAGGIIAGVETPGTPMPSAPANLYDYRPGLPEDHADTRPEMIYTDMTTTGETLP